MVMDCRSPPTATTHSSSLQDSSLYGGSGCTRLEEDHVLNMSPTPSSSSHLSPPVASSVELMKEIATIEVQILQLERYLLSLYRTAFQQHLPALLGNHGTHLKDKTGSHFKIADNQPNHEMDLAMSKYDFDHEYQIFPSCTLAGSNDQIQATPKSSSRKEKKQSDSGHRSLADHLGASRMDDILNYPDRLSEEIVRCISSIYCKFASPGLSHKGLSISSTSSLCSSSTFSPRNISGSWSPQLNEEAKGCDFEALKDETGPYAGTVEVVKICLDDDSFIYAATMLQQFRSLVKSLEKVDPRKMKREEKLAFWLNIHNSLVMHAYLAYGTHNFVRSTSVLKAAYNVGGQCINAYAIQSSILGIRSHYSAPWLQTLLSPRKRFMTGSAQHPYAIEYSEPLVHFALCSGSYCDPSVRVYNAKNVFQDLKVAKDEFIRGSIYIHKETKIHLPKILSYYARDVSLSVSEILETVCGCLPELQQKAIRTCMTNRPDKNIYWEPQSSSFRYLIHKDVAEARCGF